MVCFPYVGLEKCEISDTCPVQHLHRKKPYCFLPSEGVVLTDDIIAKIKMAICSNS